MTPPIQFILAFNALYDLQVFVHCGLRSPVVYALEDQDIFQDRAYRVHLQCVGGHHYNALTEGDGYTMAKVKCETETIGIEPARPEGVGASSMATFELEPEVPT